jgi:hypothetical protein
MALNRPDMRVLRDAVFPIFPMRHLANDGRRLLRGNPSEQGTAFIISRDGVFLTARHVVNHADADSLSIAAVNVVTRRYAFYAVKSLEMHPEFDVAIGTVGPPRAKNGWPHPLTLGTGPLSVDAGVFVYGFPQTRVEERELPGKEELGLALEYFPRVCHGKITDYHPTGVTIGKEPAYTHTADTLSGISGGPLIRTRTKVVHGITRSGDHGFGVATDVRAILNGWPIKFFGGKSIRQHAHADSGTIALR